MECCDLDLTLGGPLCQVLAYLTLFLSCFSVPVSERNYLYGTLDLVSRQIKFSVTKVIQSLMKEESPAVNKCVLQLQLSRMQNIV